MGRYIQQTQSRSELQQRIAADLRAKALASSKPELIAATQREANEELKDYRKNRNLIFLLLALGVAIYWVFSMFLK